MNSTKLAYSQKTQEFRVLSATTEKIDPRKQYFIDRLIELIAMKKFLKSKLEHN